MFSVVNTLAIGIVYPKCLLSLQSQDAHILVENTRDGLVYKGSREAIFELLEKLHHFSAHRYI